MSWKASCWWARLHSLLVWLPRSTEFAAVQYRILLCWLMDLWSDPAGHFLKLESQISKLLYLKWVIFRLKWVNIILLKNMKLYLEASQCPFQDANNISKRFLCPPSVLNVSSASFYALLRSASWRSIANRPFGGISLAERRIAPDRTRIHGVVWWSFKWLKQQGSMLSLKD